MPWREEPTLSLWQSLQTTTAEERVKAIQDKNSQSVVELAPIR